MVHLDLIGQVIKVLLPWALPKLFTLLPIGVTFTGEGGFVDANKVLWYSSLSIYYSVI